VLYDVYLFRLSSADLSPLTQRINPMRKLLLTTAAVAAAIAVAVAGEPSFGTLTDARDGQTYRTVKAAIYE
jgi:hypothetical protein